MPEGIDDPDKIVQGTIKRTVPVEIALTHAIPSATKRKSTTIYLTGKREKKLLLEKSH